MSRGRTPSRYPELFRPRESENIYSTARRREGEQTNRSEHGIVADDSVAELRAGVAKESQMFLLRVIRTI